MGQNLGAGPLFEVLRRKKKSLGPTEQPQSVHGLNKKRYCNEKLNPTTGLRWQSKMPRSSHLIPSLLPFKERPKHSDSAWMAPVLWKAYHLLGGQENAGCALWRRENIEKRSEKKVWTWKVSVVVRVWVLKKNALNCWRCCALHVHISATSRLM